jgi:hypothetical protein
MKTLAIAVAVIASFAAIQAQEVYKVGNGDTRSAGGANRGHGGH